MGRPPGPVWERLSLPLRPLDLSFAVDTTPSGRWGEALPVQMCVSDCGHSPRGHGAPSEGVLGTGATRPNRLGEPSRMPTIRASERLRQTLDDGDQLLTTEPLMASEPQQLLRPHDHSAPRRSSA
jgi:hypothetical protein